jgi:hypothetical protein
MRWNLLWINSPPLSQKTRRTIFGVFLANLSICLLYSTYENYSPSPLVNEYGTYLWLPFGLGFYFFFVTKCFVPRDTLPEGNYYVGVAVCFAATLYITNLIITAGIPALVNRIVGEPFDFQTRVTRKYWGTRIFHGHLHVENYEPRAGFIWVDESLWKEVREGDTVTISGVQSVLGKSLDTIEKAKSP